MHQHNDLAQYSVSQCFDEVSLPSHFKPDMYTTAALDNFDHEERTLSGIGGSHDTVCVLFQDKPSVIPLKPLLSASGILHRPTRFN